MGLKGQIKVIGLCIIDNVLLDSGTVRPRGLLFNLSDWGIEGVYTPPILSMKKFNRFVAICYWSYNNNSTDIHKYGWCNRLRCPLARLSGLQCYSIGHNGHRINLYGVAMPRIMRMGNLHAGGQSSLGHLSLLHRFKKWALSLLYLYHDMFRYI